MVSQKQYTFGIMCLETDHDMQKYFWETWGDGTENFDYKTYFSSLCRIPTNYIKFLALKNIKFMPIFYTNND